MSLRSSIAFLLAIVCAAAVCGVVAQGHQLSELEAKQKRLAADIQATNSVTMKNAAVPTVTPEVPRELLQLRAEVARLSEQRRELASARTENERLRVQLENRRTNSASAKGAGYTRTSEAKWLGYNRPEDTLQSFFWAKKNHDLAKLLEVFTPDTVDQIKEMLQNSTRTPEQLFEEKDLPPTYRVAGREERDTDYVELEVQISPDTPGIHFYFQQIGGQWKLQRLP